MPEGVYDAPMDGSIPVRALGENINAPCNRQFGVRYAHGLHLHRPKPYDTATKNDSINVYPTRSFAPCHCL